MQVLPSDAFDAGEAARVEKRRQHLLGELERAQRKLDNENFVAKAPAAVVDEERRKLDEYREALRRSRARDLRQAEEYLLGLELFGMRFGLDRMHRLMTVLGPPQRRFASIHVVGSNGKSSTVRFIAAILERHGLRTGSYTTAPALVPRADRGGGGADLGGGLRGRGRARRACRRARRPHGRAGRPGHPVRGPDGRGLSRARSRAGSRSR